jgi:hypothetical protein
MEKATVTLNDAYFGNRSINGSDLLKALNTENVIFAVAELERSNLNLSKNNLSFSFLLNFDTVCANHASTTLSVSLVDVSLSNSNITIGPLTGYKFSSIVDGPFSDSLMTNYNASFSSGIYVEFSPTAPGSYSGNIPVNANITLNVPVIGVSLDTSTLSAKVINISCNNAKQWGY